MLKTFDYQCLCCKVIEERLVMSDEIDNQSCSKCQIVMSRLMPNPKGYVH